MKRKPLSETNPYLRSSEQYRKSLITNVSSSTAIETDQNPDDIAKQLESDQTLLNTQKASAQ